MQTDFNKYLHPLAIELKKHSVTMHLAGNRLSFSQHQKVFDCLISGKNLDATEGLSFPLDLLITEPQKITALVLSRLQLNQKIFARNCQAKKTDKKTAEEFLDNYHLMNSTKSSYNLGLYLKNELIAIASFSSGRKMRRLSEDKRSYEMIRFCTLPGMTVTGGLSKLIKHFIKEKQAGDIMTYVDLQLSDGAAFIKAGFKKHSITQPHYFLVHRKTYLRTPLKNKDEKFDPNVFYLGSDAGNIKLVLTATKTL